MILILIIITIYESSVLEFLDISLCGLFGWFFGRVHFLVDNCSSLSFFPFFFLVAFCSHPWWHQFYTTKLKVIWSKSMNPRAFLNRHSINRLPSLMWWCGSLIDEAPSFLHSLLCGLWLLQKGLLNQSNGWTTQRAMVVAAAPYKCQPAEGGA